MVHVERIRKIIGELLMHYLTTNLLTFLAPGKYTGLYYVVAQKEGVLGRLRRLEWCLHMYWPS